MTQPVPCPHCSRVLELPEDAAGRTLRCPGCDGRAKVVAVDEELALEGLLELDEPELPAPAPRAVPAEPATPVRRRRRRTHGARGGRGGAKPPSNLVWGILTTIFCCTPLGIVSIVYAAKVDGAWRDGDHAAARRASKNAMFWAGFAVFGFGALVVLAFALGWVER